MNKRRERTLKDLVDATLSLSQPQVTPAKRGNFRMQGPVDKAKQDLVTHMVEPENCKGLNIFPESQKSDYSGKSGTCNVCFAPCSSCFHVNKVVMKSNDESAGETYAENIEIRQPSVLSTVAGMNSTSDSFSENAVGKTSSRTSNASASDDGVVHSKSEGRKVSEGHDDCMSCVSGTDEHANKKCDPDDVKMKCNKPSKVSGENSDKVPPSSLKTGSNSQDLGLLKSIEAATGLLKVQNTYSRASNGKCVSHDQNPRDVKYEKPSATKKEPLEGSTKAWDSLSPKVAASDVCGDPLVLARNPIEENDDMEVEIQPIDETGDSDMVEQDVKVCDICGDAGREDLLAICCRCSDGAEHTYCMREMLAKVPEGDWLCEECQAQEHAGNGRDEKIGKVDENEKNNSGHTSSEHVNNSDVEGQRTKGSLKIPSKRHRDDDDAEVSSVVKKPALESKLGSPRPFNSGKTTALTRENSVKNLDKDRLQSSDIVPVNDMTESTSSASDLRVHKFRGTFSKSNSFNSLNSKPKVKLVDQVTQRQKSAKEPGSIHNKEGVVRSIGKSVSFKSTNAGRSESKVKMLSPRPSHAQDIKNAKQRGPLDRQHSFRTERSSINSSSGASVNPTSRIDKRPTSRGESSSLATIANQAEGKSVAALSRSSSLAARKTADLPSSSGEFKRPSVHANSTFGVSSSNVVNNNEHKYNMNNSKEDFPCPVVTERPPLDGNEGIPDGLPRLRDLTNPGERMKDCSGSRSGPPSAKPLRDDGGSNLKAAIEAAVLRKPGMFRKHLSVSTLGCEVTSHQDPTKKKLTSDAELPERPIISRNLTVDTLKQETSNFVKPSSLVPVDGVLNSSARNMFSNAPAAMPFFLKSVAVPEHEYIWQGSFEICRIGKTSDAWDGIQAHLSTCASPKVIEAVNNFNSRIVLYEVPRSSTWPMHFQENGVREDNIALFFFAKDHESYDKFYKVLLEKMMKNDLALKGNVNGVELLIFHSSQLPDNSQRWNMFFFLWGVFRGKKESCLQQQMPESLNQICVPRNTPPPIMSLPENRCSLRPIAEDGSEEDAAPPVLGVSASQELQQLLASRVVNRDWDTKSLDRLNDSSSPAVQSNNMNQCLETGGTSQEGKGDIISSCVPPFAMGSNSSSEMKQMLMHSDTTSLKVADEGTVLNEKTRTQNQVKSRLADLMIEDGENLLKDNHRDITDLNRLPFDHNEPVLPAGPSSVLPPALLHSNAGHVRVDNGDSCGGALEKMNHLVLVDRDESAERRFFPTESQGIQLATPWKMHNLLEQVDRAPDLELALGGGAETKSLTLAPLNFVMGNSKVNEVRNSIREDEAAAGIKAEDDVAASLSLSLSFPFPDRELSPKPAPKNEQRERSMLLFGNLKR